MNPPLDFADALTQLAILTSQTANFTFNVDELTQALTAAWQDTNVVNIVWDGSLTYAMGTYQYPVPDDMNTVKDIYIEKNSSQYPDKIASNLYEVVDGNIQFHNKAQYVFSDNYTLFIKGGNKLTVDDDLQTDAQINYVLSLAALILLRQLALKAAFVFLRNDISMSDIIRVKNDVQTDVIRYKQALAREYENA